MEILFIVFCMGVASGIGHVLFAGLPLPVQVALRSGLMVLGAVIGYLGIWLMKPPVQNTVALPSTAFKKQVAGNPCSSCKDYLLLAVDGDVCTHCTRVFCNRCLKNSLCEACSTIRPSAAEQDSPTSAP